MTTVTDRTRVPPLPITRPTVTGGERAGRIERWVWSVAGIASLLLAWTIGSATGLINPFLLPGPLDVIQQAVSLTLDGTLAADIAASLSRVLVGFVIAVAVAVPMGVAMGLSKRISYLINPLVELLRPIPPIAIVPLTMLWFGIGESSKIFLIAFGAFFPVLLNTLAGIRSIETVHVRAAQSLGASRWQVVREVVLPGAFPNIVIGARLGLSMGFIVLVAAELIAAESGLGFLIQDARQRFATDVMLVGIIVIGLLGTVLNHLMLLIERRAVPWRFLGSR